MWSSKATQYACWCVDHTWVERFSVARQKTIFTCNNTLPLWQHQNHKTIKLKSFICMFIMQNSSVECFKLNIKIKCHIIQGTLSHLCKPQACILCSNCKCAPSQLQASTRSTASLQTLNWNHAHAQVKVCISSRERVHMLKSKHARAQMQVCTCSCQASTCSNASVHMHNCKCTCTTASRHMLNRKHACASETKHKLKSKHAHPQLKTWKYSSARLHIL